MPFLISGYFQSNIILYFHIFFVLFHLIIFVEVHLVDLSISFDLFVCLFFSFMNSIILSFIVGLCTESPEIVQNSREPDSLSE